MRVVYYNGKFVPESEAKISIFDSALMFGDMVFEMTRSFGKKQFKLREHIDRLYSSIDYVKIPIDISKTEMEEICFKTIGYHCIWLNFSVFLVAHIVNVSHIWGLSFVFL